MALFDVEIKEVLVRTVTVEAENEKKAMEEVERRYKEEEIVLGAEDFDYCEIDSPVPVKENGRTR